MSGNELLAICLAMLTMVVCMVIMLLTMEYIKKNRYQREKDKEIGRIDSQREYFERKIYELQKEMSENQRRWNDANKLIVGGQTGTLTNNKDVQYLLRIPFFKGTGIGPNDLIVDSKAVFVLTPFISEEKKTFITIKDVCSGVGLQCRRGDESYRNNDILSHIIKEILRARIIIVNINGRNPNVFYELGICHAIGKPVIIISSVDSEERIPFDVLGKNIVIYRTIGELHELLKDELLKMFIDDNQKKMDLGEI